MMFYFDEKLKNFEDNKDFNNALFYLESLYGKNNSVEILNSLIGFSWYYFVEGPIDSGKYDREDTTIAREFWKKYIDKVIGSGDGDFSDIDPSTLYICGYTLSLHGLFLDGEYEQIGSRLMKMARETCHDEALSELINIFLTMEKQRRYKPLKVSDNSLSRLFDENSLIGEYFLELYKQ